MISLSARRWPRPAMLFAGVVAAAAVATPSPAAAGVPPPCPKPPPQPFCEESVNPHGANVPPAGSTTLPGPKGGQNEDGFYLVGANTECVLLVDGGSGFVFGVFPSGTTIKYTEANGAEPSVKDIGSDNGQAGAVDSHLTGTGDLLVFAANCSGAPSGTPVSCLVPPPPK